MSFGRDDFSAKAAQTGPGQTFTTNDSGERKVFKSGMQRDTAFGKLLWHLVAFGPMLKRWAALLTRGAIKYEENNWMKASGEEELARFRVSAYRHFMQWFLGEEPDEDHAAAVFFNINGAEYVKERLSVRQVGTLSGRLGPQIEITEGKPYPVVGSPEQKNITDTYTEAHSTYEMRRQESLGRMVARHDAEVRQHKQWAQERHLGGDRA